MTEYWCEFAWLGGDNVEAGVNIEVDGDRLASIATGAPALPDAVRLGGLTLPALANTHSHAFHRALRGRTHGGRGTFWDWRQLMYQVARRLDPDNYYELARAVFGEMVLAGVGVVGEFHYVHHQPDGSPYDDPNAMGSALVAAAAGVGIRLTLLDTLYLRGGFTDTASYGPRYVAIRPEQLRFSDQTAAQWSDRVQELAAVMASPLSRLGAAIHSVRAVDPASMKVATAWAEAHDAPLHVHVSEQPAENEQCLATFASTPVELLSASGVLGPRTTLVHATHLTDSDIATVGSSGSGCCFCPTTERDLADGIGPSRELADAGVEISLGSDSHAVVDLFEEARAIELNQRLLGLERGVHRVPELARMASVSGYRSLGWPDGGELVVGGLADFCTVGLDSVRLGGAHQASALAAVVFSGSAADVHHVVVGGQPVVSQGQHRSIDVPTELARSIEKVTTP